MVEKLYYLPKEEIIMGNILRKKTNIDIAKDLHPKVEESKTNGGISQYATKKFAKCLKSRKTQ